METKDPRARTRVKQLTTIAVLAMVAFSYLGVRLFQLQVLNGKRFASLSRMNSVRILTESAPRGDILDRNGIPLATTRLARSIYLTVPLNPGIIKWITRYTGLGEPEIRKRLEGYPVGRVALVRDAGIKLVSTLEEAGPSVSGLTLRDEPLRIYPLGGLTAHISGYLGSNPRSMAQKGTTGLEEVLQYALTGRDGGSQILVDSRGKTVGPLGYVEPVKGKDITTTLDMGLQSVMVSALSEAARPFKGKGAAIAMDPRTGAIRAIASIPSFDPNLFIEDYSGELGTVLNSPEQPMLNRATVGLYPPGSAFKPVTVMAALESGVANGASIFDCRGYDPRIPSKKCWIVSEGKVHGKQTLIEGIKHSCNIVFYELGRRVGPEGLAEWSRRLGLGTRTGMDIVPEGPGGIVPTREWKEKTLGKPWYPAETLDYSIGQGFVTLTPMQLLRMYAAFANGRGLPHPYLVERVGHGAAKESEGGPGRAVPVKFKAEALEILRAGLEAVTTPGGTAYGAFAGSSLKVAGKTGSAQNATGKAHAWFAGYAPAKKPRIVVVVLVEQGEAGSRAAAPVARRIIEEWALIQGLSDNPMGNPHVSAEIENRRNFGGSVKPSV